MILLVRVAEYGEPRRKGRKAFCAWFFVWKKGGGKMRDVVIIGGGVIGAGILRELTRYAVKAVLVEKEEDVASGASKANSAIVHAGYDCVP